MIILPGATLLSSFMMLVGLSHVKLLYMAMIRPCYRSRVNAVTARALAVVVQ